MNFKSLPLPGLMFPGFDTILKNRMTKMTKKEPCPAIHNTLKCTQPKGHPGQHANCGIMWEENIKIPVFVQHYIIEGSITGHHHLWTEYVAHDGRVFAKREYQVIALPGTSQSKPEEKPAYTSPFTGDKK